MAYNWNYINFNGAVSKLNNSQQENLTLRKRYHAYLMVLSAISPLLCDRRMYILRMAS